MPDYLSGRPGPAIYAHWLAISVDLQRPGRREELSATAKLTLVIQALGGDEALWQTLRDMETVSAWWP